MFMWLNKHFVSLRHFVSELSQTKNTTEIRYQILGFHESTRHDDLNHIYLTIDDVKSKERLVLSPKAIVADKTRLALFKADEQHQIIMMALMMKRQLKAEPIRFCGVSQDGGHYYCDFYNRITQKKFALFLDTFNQAHPLYHQLPQNTLQYIESLRALGP